MHPQNVFYPKNDYAESYGTWRSPSCADPNQSINQSLIPNGKGYSNLQFLFKYFLYMNHLCLIVKFSDNINFSIGPSVMPMMLPSEHQMAMSTSQGSLPMSSIISPEGGDLGAYGHHQVSGSAGQINYQGHQTF